VNLPLRVMVASVGWTGHAFPVIALARELHARGHEVMVETIAQWRDVVEGLGLRFAVAEEHMDFAGLRGDGPRGPTLAEAAESLLSVMREFRPDVVVSDLFTVAPALAADAAEVPRATLIPHPYPVHEPGLPLFFLGMRPPRTSLGRSAWRAMGPLGPLLQPRLRRVRGELNATRAELGLPPIESYHGPISDRLTMVATFPQLEYPRKWPPHVHVTGPMMFDLPPPGEIDLPAGDEPLVLVNSSTSLDPELALVRAAVEALEAEPVRVVATMSRGGRAWIGHVPKNAVVADWVSYEQVLPRAALVVCAGGHGTVARVLAEGVPALVCPLGVDMAENGARVAWSGAGLMLPRPLLRSGPLRWAVRRVLADGRFAARAREIAAWSRENSGASRGAELVETLARG
jgi:UDP:flavonoid glycosyltransferase YjiC (YdhE family)